MNILDFQVSRVTIPVCDLSYFLYACAPKSILDDLDKYLQIYHESLSDNLRKLGSDPEKIFPYIVLKEQWKNNSKYGFIMALIVIRLMLCDSDESPDLEKFFDTPGKDAVGVWDYSIRQIDEYRHRIRDIVLFMHENDYLA